MDGTNCECGTNRELGIAAIARVCHEANRAYCRALDDVSQEPWDKASAEIRASAIQGVELHLSNPDAAPEVSHEAWSVFKRAHGWVHGPVKNEEKKEHPCLVPYNELPLDQRVKDTLFIAIVGALRDKRL